MLTYQQILKSMQDMPYHNRLYKRLNKLNISLLYMIASELEALDIHSRERKINRLFIDNLTPPKNHRIIIELLSNANSIAYQQQKEQSNKA